jgi:hypothetical protein
LDYVRALDGPLTPWRLARALDEGRKAAELERQARDLAEEARRAPGPLLGPLPATIAKVRRRAAYHRARANGRPMAPRVQNCGREAKVGHCRNCGVVQTWRRRCKLRLACPTCAELHAKRVRRDTAQALQSWTDYERARWDAAGQPFGQLKTVTMLTLTWAHVGTVAERRAEFSRYWNRFRTWYSERFGERLVYRWVSEFTPGRMRDGHPHAHVVCMLPRIDYAELRDEWERATDGLGRRVVVSRAWSCSVGDAARYISKYVSKATLDGSIPVELAAEWIRAQHGRRLVSSSYHFACKRVDAHEWGDGGICFAHWSIDPGIVYCHDDEQPDTS